MPDDAQEGVGYLRTIVASVPDRLEHHAGAANGLEVLRAPQQNARSLIEASSRWRASLTRRLNALGAPPCLPRIRSGLRSMWRVVPCERSDFDRSSVRGMCRVFAVRCGRK